MATPERENFHLMLRVRRPLDCNERLAIATDAAWVAAVQTLLTPKADGSYPWQRIELADGQVLEYKTLEAFIQAEEGLRTSPARMLKLLEADPAEGASEAAEKLRGALTQHGGDRGNQWTGGKVDNVNLGTDSKKATGNSRARLIREIRQLAESNDHRAALAADLLERVHAREVSANAAAIQLGLRNKALQFDLYKLSSEVRTEIDNLKAQEDWTTAEVIEEALRAYFRVISDDEEIEPTAQVADPAPPTKPKDSQAKPLRRHQAPEGFLQGVHVADMCGVNRNSLGARVQAAHGKGKPAELNTPDGRRTFQRRIGEKFWIEIS